VWGCGYRLEIAVSDVNATAKLTLPAIAASVELGQVEASVELSVKGYPLNDMWDVIPPPAPLDVDTYKRYLEAGANIQQKFVKLADRAVLVLLASSNARTDMLIGGISDAALDASAAAMWALSCLSSQHILEQALEDFPGNRENDQEDL